ncbi:MAG TPA: YlbF family regulator [Acholeplasmataceae bacterium]|nr:YlbF family regulator [Acholeplasmataceae bacterium]
MNEKEKLIDMLEQSEEIKRYKKIEELINSNKKLTAKFNQLKVVQKQLVNAKHIGKEEATKKLQQQYDDLYEEIETYPLMSDYMALQGDINDLMQQIVSIIEDGLNDEMKK